VLTGNQHGRKPIGNEAVRKAQSSIAGKIPLVFIVYDQTKIFSEKKWMKDFVHYNQYALNDIGRTIAENIIKLP